MGLRHVVITTVTRDDLADGGAAHFVATIEAVRAAVPEAAVEVLTSDFGGRLESVDTVAAARPDVFNHNLETVPRLYAEVRPEADYARSLGVLERVRETQPDLPTKSGLMLGLGETPDEVRRGHARPARAAACRCSRSASTCGRVRRTCRWPSSCEPEVFALLAREAYRLGFAAVASAPFVRSSYHAGELSDAWWRG